VQPFGSGIMKVTKRAQADHAGASTRLRNQPQPNASWLCVRTSREGPSALGGGEERR
jgi:hypothetical protein